MRPCCAEGPLIIEAKKKFIPQGMKLKRVMNHAIVTGYHLHRVNREIDDVRFVLYS